MKIIAFELKEYEAPFFSPLVEKYGQDKLLLKEQTLNQDTLHMLQDVRGVSISIHSILDPPMLRAMRKQGVKYICTRTIGYDHIDLACATRLGFKVCNVHYEPNGVAEYAIMLMLMCLRKIKAANMRGQANDFSLNGLMGMEMRNMTVGVLGTGGIGSAVIKLLQGFGCRLIAHDPCPNQELNVPYLSLKEIYAQADIISLHLPLLDPLHHMINRQAIARMKPGVIIVNTARGGLLDASALIEGIESGHIGALALDVFERESGIFHSDLRLGMLTNRDLAYLRQFPNVVITQHIAFFTDEVIMAMVVGGIEKLHALNQGVGGIAL